LDPLHLLQIQGSFVGGGLFTFSPNSALFVAPDPNTFNGTPDIPISDVARHDLVDKLLFPPNWTGSASQVQFDATGDRFYVLDSQNKMLVWFEN
jgi:hypothetical protein